MTGETVSATTTISTSAETVFAVLADPSQHAAIDGTGWVRDSPHDQRLTGSGQIFRMAIYHPNHPDGSYEMLNQVLAFEPPRVISWKPGYVSPATGKLEFGGAAPYNPTWLTIMDFGLPAAGRRAFPAKASLRSVSSSV
jgi:uncharacterized protein YndB with AHSA1/START domain